MWLFAKKGKKALPGSKLVPEHPINIERRYTSGPIASTPVDSIANKPEEPASSPLSSVDFAQDSVDSIEQGSRGGVPHQGILLDDMLVLKANESARLRSSVIPVAGKIYVVNYRARAVADSTNGVGLNYFVGTLMLNKNGDVVRWWAEQKPVSMRDGIVQGAVEILAPREAVKMFVGWSGPRALTEGPTSDGRVGILSSVLLTAG